MRYWRHLNTAVVLKNFPVILLLQYVFTLTALKLATAHQSLILKGLGHQKNIFSQLIKLKQYFLYMCKCLLNFLPALSLF
jgi:hypothetical protein